MKKIFVFFLVIAAAVFIGCSGGDSDALSGPPAAPTGLTAYASSTSQIYLNWDHYWTNVPDNPYAYAIECSLDLDSWWTDGFQYYELRYYYCDGLNAGTTYYFRVRAYNDYGYSYSNIASATTYSAPGSPEAPGGLTATAVSTNQIDLSWTDNAYDETGYKVEYSIDQVLWTGAGSLPANITAYQLTGLAAGTTYYFRVYAYNEYGNSNRSEIVSATTISNSAGTPAAPTALTVTVISDNQINLFWTDNADNETGYQLEYSTDDIEWFLKAFIGADSETFNCIGLYSGTTYYFRVCAFNDYGHSGYSNIVSATTSPPGSPAAPTNLTATAASTSQINLSWTDNANDETGYAVERSLSGSSGPWSEIASSLPANTTNYQDTGLSAGTPYYYRVRAYNGNGYSGYSNTADAYTSSGLSLPPELTTNDVTSFSSSSAYLGGNISYTGMPAYYERGVCYSTSINPTTASSKVIVSGSGTGSFTTNVTGLSANTTYYVRAYAINSAGTAYGDEVSFKTSGILPSLTTAAVTGVTSFDATMGGSISNAGTPAYTERGVCYATTSNPTTANDKCIIPGSGTGSFSEYIEGLTPGKTYYVRAYAINAEGTVYGTQVYFSTPTAPAGPTLTGPSSASSTFQLTSTYIWGGLTSTSDHIELEYSYSPTSGYEFTTSTAYNDHSTNFYYTITLDPWDYGRTIYFRVRAYTGSGYTNYSNVVAVVIPVSGGSSSLDATPTRLNIVRMTYLTPSYAGQVFNNPSPFRIGRNHFYTSSGGFSYSDLDDYRAYIYFDINSQITGKNIKKATLKMYVNLKPDMNAGHSFEVALAAGAWTSTGLTYNNQPYYYTSPVVTQSTPSASGVWWEVDVTNLVKLWANGTAVNNGFTIRDPSIYIPYSTVDFSCSFSNSTKPVLSIEFQ